MKKMKKFIAPLALLMFMLIGTAVRADFPPPPPFPPGFTGHGSGADQHPDATCPIDGGLSIFLILGAMYGSKKLYKATKEEN